MQFKVPQFLDIEDKIFGPFTFRQFVYLAGGAGICFILFRLLGFLLGAIPIIIVASFVLALTFYRPNNKPFVHMLEAGFKFLIQDKLYIWKRRKKEAERVSSLEGVKIEAGSREPKLTGSKLKDLAWSLDVLDSHRDEKGS